LTFLTLFIYTLTGLWGYDDDQGPFARDNFTIGWFSSTAYLLQIRCDLVTLTFDFLTLDNGHVVNIITNFEDPMPVLPYMHGGISPTYLKFVTPICLFTIQFLSGYDDD